MRTFFDKGASQEFKVRLASLSPDSVRQWGKMNSAQMVAHLCKGMEQAMGEVRPPWGVFIKSAFRKQLRVRLPKTQFEGK